MRGTGGRVQEAEDVFAGARDNLIEDKANAERGELRDEGTAHSACTHRMRRERVVEAALHDGLEVPGLRPEAVDVLQQAIEARELAVDRCGAAHGAGSAV